jgi:hypothetical protein
VQRLIIGDVFDVMDKMEPRSVNLVLTSPPFLALRSYLPPEHPDKGKEIGTEQTPADYLDTLLRLTARWRELLAADGSLCLELGDTYSGSGGAGGDYNAGGMRDGQQRFDGSASRAYGTGSAPRPPRRAPQRKTERPNGCTTDSASESRVANRAGPGWPLHKSLVGIPQLYELSLIYGRNILRSPVSASQMLDFFERILPDFDGDAWDIIAMMRQWEAKASSVQVVEFEPWRVRNVVAWCRPNPPVGRLGDKVRPATSYLTIACVGKQRYFDLDAVRTPVKDPEKPGGMPRRTTFPRPDGGTGDGHPRYADRERKSNPAGAPPLDHWWYDEDDSFDQDAWLIPTAPYKGAHYATWPPRLLDKPILAMCPPEGTVLDPFAGSGTTLMVAKEHGRNGIGIDLDPENIALARKRVGDDLVVEHV